MADYVELCGEVLRTTDKACLLRLDDYPAEDAELWIPWSQIEDNGENLVPGYKGRLYVQRWFAEKEGLDISE